MVIRDILLARSSGGHVHLCHMSTRGSVELIRWGKERGIRVTAEVCPHHLSLTEDSVEGYDTNAKMNPPLRTAADVAALREAVRDGTIDLVATDHAPHHYDEKEREFADAPNGIVGLETALAVIAHPCRAHRCDRPGHIGESHVGHAGASFQASRRLAAAGKCGGRHNFRSSARVDRGSGRFSIQGPQFTVCGRAAHGPRDVYHRQRSNRP